MMKRSISLILCIILALCLFCGCGASAPMASDKLAAPAEPAAPAAPAETVSPSYGYVTESEMIAEDQADSNLPANTKLIYTATMDLESTSFDAAIAGLEKLVFDMGGYFENSNVHNYGSYRQGNYTVRVPAGQFNSFCTAVGELCQLNSIERSARDVSEAYYDTEARLATQKTKLERLQNLLAKAETMEDIIDLETALSETEYQIEQLTGSLRKYDSLVGYSTIHIYINEVYELTEIEEPVIGFGAKLADAFGRGSSNFVDNLQQAMIRFARNWVSWVIWILILVVAPIIVLCTIRKKNKSRRSIPTPKTPEADSKPDEEK